MKLVGTTTEDINVLVEETLGGYAVWVGGYRLLQTWATEEEATAYARDLPGVVR